MTTKKDIPLNLLKAIEDIVQPNLDIIKLKKEDNTYYSFIEIDNNSKNYFKIFIDGTDIVGNYNKNNYACEWKPTDATNANSILFQKSMDEVIAQFKDWTKLIRDLNDIPSVHDDNFTQFYSDFYFNEFKIVDKDADSNPFNPIQQDLIELYLNSLLKKIENSKGKVSDTLKKEFISEIIEIKDTLPTSTKNQVLKKITKVFGKLYKICKPFAKEIVKEVSKQLIKKLIENGFEYIN